MIVDSILYSASINCWLFYCWAGSACELRMACFVVVHQISELLRLLSDLSVLFSDLKSFSSSDLLPAQVLLLSFREFRLFINFSKFL